MIEVNCMLCRLAVALLQLISFPLATIMLAMSTFWGGAAVFIIIRLVQASSNPVGASPNHDWHDAHATFYGDMKGGETMRKCRIFVYIYSGYLHNWPAR